MEAKARRSAAAHGLQRALAAGALIATLPVLFYALTSYVFVLHVLTAIAVAVPLFLFSRAVAFTRACLIVGLALLPWGVLGFLLGMFLFWPAALLLLLAAFADPRRHAVAAKVLGVAGGLVMAGFLAAVAAFSWHFYIAPALAEPHTYRAATDPDTFYDELGDHDERLKQLGATDVSGTAEGDMTYLDVSFPVDLAEPRRAALKREIEQLPGVSHVDLCPVRDCG
ncbi:hypothetical protein AB0J57_16375 [Streptomyces sp. NPDC049837]|uniref:hypothetical protein n=1 Tax=Streptomyces sp. NPDC049837 TaxID=3155277 RepID=UPI00341DA177